MTNLLEELTRLLNYYSEENESNTPDYQLAEYMLGCLGLFNRAIQARDAWYGMNPEPGVEWWTRVPEPPRLPPSRQVESES